VSHNVPHQLLYHHRLQGVISETISDMIKRYNGSATLSLETCEYLNISVCPASTDSNEQVVCTSDHSNINTCMFSLIS